MGHVRPVRLRDPRKHAALNSRPDRVRHGAPRGDGGCVSGLSYRRRMVEIAEYEKRGDLAAPFQLSKQAEKKQREAERIREAVRCDLPPLAWEQYIAGEPCPGCGRPYRDAEPWEVRGTMNLTDEERTRYDAEQARFKQAHSECHSHRHSVEGSLTLHCGKCCPAPPLSPEQRETIGKVFSTRTPPQQLMKWRLRLFCGHVAEETAHYTHKTLHGAFTGSTACPECGLDPATVVDGEAVGLVEEPAAARVAGGSASAATRAGKPTKAELGAKVQELEAEVARLGGE